MPVHYTIVEHTTVQIELMKQLKCQSCFKSRERISNFKFKLFKNSNLTENAFAYNSAMVK
jgi:hypothetical protein